MRTLAALITVAVLGFASTAHAGSLDVPDLTGTWTGKLVCKGISSSPFFTFGDFNFVAKEATLEITQDLDAIIAALEAEDPAFPFALNIQPLCGAVVVNPVKPKQVRAGLAAPVGESEGSAFAVAFNNVKVFPVNDKGISGKIKGSGVLLLTGLGGNVNGSCKWTFERTDETEPMDVPESCEVMES